MNYRVLGSVSVKINLGEGFIAIDPNAERYKHCVGKLIEHITGTLILEFKNATREVFRRTSLIPTDEELSNAPPQRYGTVTWVEAKCAGCKCILKHEKSGFKEGFKYHCKKCRAEGVGSANPHSLSDKELLDLYFKQLMSCVDIADFVGSKTKRRPSPSTIGRWLKLAIKSDPKGRTLRTQGESSILARYQSAVKAGRIEDDQR